jgi:hypothetical protein
MIGPSGEVAQQFPVVLAEFCGPQGAACRLRRWIRRRAGGSESGRFQFPVDRGSVQVEYRVRWAEGVVAELEITIAATDTLAVAAHQELQQYFTLDLQEDT